MSSNVDKQRPSLYYPKFFEQLPSMEGKSIVITGASKGLGYVTALSLVKKGAAVYILNRQSERMEKSLNELSQASIGPPPVFIDCDLLDFASVRNAAAKLRTLVSDKNGVDVLCCNAGIMLQPDKASKDGYDITISTNVLSHFLLTKELFPELSKAASVHGEARIVSMSSASGHGLPTLNPIFFEKKGGNLGGQRSSYERYHQSKLSNFLFTSALDKKLRRLSTSSSSFTKNTNDDTSVCSNIKAIACTPGVCATDMFLHATTVMNGKPAPLDMVPSVEDGCIAQLKCICDPSVESGELWEPQMGGGNNRDSNNFNLVKVDMTPPSIHVTDVDAEKLWELCEKAVGKFHI